MAYLNSTKLACKMKIALVSQLMWDFGAILEANKTITQLEVGTYPNQWIVGEDLKCRQYTTVNNITINLIDKQN
jgi:hypothetical protein